MVGKPTRDEEAEARSIKALVWPHHRRLSCDQTPVLHRSVRASASKAVEGLLFCDHFIRPNVVSTRV